MCWQFLWFLMVIKLFIISLSYVYLYFYLDSELNPALWILLAKGKYLHPSNECRPHKHCVHMHRFRRCHLLTRFFLGIYPQKKQKKFLGFRSFIYLVILLHNFCWNKYVYIFTGFRKYNLQRSWYEWVCPTKGISLHKPAWPAFRRIDSKRNTSFLS